MRDAPTTPPGNPRTQPPPVENQKTPINPVDYIGLVHFIARQQIKGKPKTVSYEDLVGYGMVGLCEATKRFDGKRGLKFTTFATWRIRGAMLDGLRVMGGRKRGDVEAIVIYLDDVLNDGTSEWWPVFEPSDHGHAALDAENVIACRQALRRVSPSTRAAVDRLLHLDHGELIEEARRLGISKGWMSRIRNVLLERVRKANGE